MMENKMTAILSLLFIFSIALKAQVPVREEPRHVPVLQNKYIRLLDVHLPPGDTTQFHIHATPSLFVILSNAATASQTKGEAWIKDQAVSGKTWYRSFSPEVLVHRVCNLDTVEFHVNDIEILSSYNDTVNKKPLPFTLLFENEKAFAYRLTAADFNKQITKSRGPMIAALVSGTGIIFHNAANDQTIEIKTGGYLYIDPGTPFNLSANEKGPVEMVFFEIK